MASVKTCDMCQEMITDTNPIILKLFLTPILPGKGRADHGSYSAHMDVGKCCNSEVLKYDWQKRKSRTEYNNGRRLRAVS